MRRSSLPTSELLAKLPFVSCGIFGQSPSCDSSECFVVRRQICRVGRSGLPTLETQRRNGQLSQLHWMRVSVASTRTRRTIIVIFLRFTCGQNELRISVLRLSVFFVSVHVHRFFVALGKWHPTHIVAGERCCGFHRIAAWLVDFFLEQNMFKVASADPTCITSTPQ